MEIGTNAQSTQGHTISEIQSSGMQQPSARQITPSITLSQFQSAHGTNNQEDGPLSHKYEYGSWVCPHDAEQQKHMWHHESLRMGIRRVQDKWGFSSTGVSRSHTPEPSKTKEDIAATKAASEETRGESVQRTTECGGV